MMVGLVALLVLGVAPAPASTAPPEAWGTTFCGAFGKWSDTITKGAAEIQSSRTTTESNPAQGKAIITAFLDGFAGTTRDFYKRMKRAGDPETANGSRIQKSVLRGIAGIEARIGDLQSLAAALPDADPASFQASVNTLVTAFDAVSTPFDNAMTKVEKLDEDDDLSDALRELKVCKKQFG